MAFAKPVGEKAKRFAQVNTEGLIMLFAKLEMLFLEKNLDSSHFVNLIE